MRVAYAEGLLTGPTSQQAMVRFLVDSGATHTLVPHNVSCSTRSNARSTRCACCWRKEPTAKKGSMTENTLVIIPERTSSCAPVFCEAHLN